MIEIAGITAVTAMRNKTRLHFLVINVDPVDRMEPSVALDIHTTVLQIAVSSRQIHLQDVLQYVS